MFVKWFPPLDRLLGPVSRIELDGPISVAALLARFCEEEPRLGRYAHVQPGDSDAWHLLVVRGSEVLTLGDSIEPGDRVDIMVPVEGG